MHGPHHIRSLFAFLSTLPCVGAGFCGCRTTTVTGTAAGIRKSLVPCALAANEWQRMSSKVALDETSRFPLPGTRESDCNKCTHRPLPGPALRAHRPKGLRETAAECSERLALETHGYCTARAAPLHTPSTTYAALCPTRQTLQGAQSSHVTPARRSPHIATSAPMWRHCFLTPPLHRTTPPQGHPTHHARTLACVAFSLAL